MRLKNFLVEFSQDKEFGTLVILDIDETIFKTFAKIKVIKDGKVFRELSNQEFNTYKLQPGESFDFGEFRDAELFNKTSIPIPKTVDRIKRMFSSINKQSPTVIMLTARADFDDKETFLDTFRKHGIPIDKIYVERAGNMKTGTTDERKKSIMMKYIMTGKYTTVLFLDDDEKNLRTFAKLGKSLPQEAYDAVRKHNGLEDDEMVTIHFNGIKVLEDGSIKRIW